MNTIIIGIIVCSAIGVFFGDKGRRDANAEFSKQNPEIAEMLNKAFKD